MIHNDDVEIPKVDLERYRFSPPGSMGWSAAEYEEILQHPDTDFQSEPFSPPSVPLIDLKELSLSPDHQVDLPKTEWAEEKARSERKKKGPPKTDTKNVQSESVTAADGQETIKEIKHDEWTENPQERTHEADNEEKRSEFIIDPNPPAGPWLAKNLISFYKGVIHEKKADH